MYGQGKHKSLKGYFTYIKYMIDTKDCFYLIKTDRNINREWELCVYSDVDYTGDNDTRKGVIGYIVLINGAVISWRLLSHKTVILSVIEAEYSTITDVYC